MRQKEAISAGSEWTEKSVQELQGSPFERIGKGWMLITAGNAESDRGNWNTMTASWGGLGVLWRKNVAFIFVRSSRHTRGFVDANPLFTLSFFDESCRAALNLCGEKSGRNIDKASAAGLTPVFFTGAPVAGTVSFKEAKDIIICKKIYAQDIDSALFLDKEIIKDCYGDNDFHRMYVGEIVGYKMKIIA